MEDNKSPKRLPYRQSIYVSKVRESNEDGFKVNIMSAENASSCDVGDSGDENNVSFIGPSDDDGKSNLAYFDTI